MAALAVVAALILVLSVMYAYAASKTKENYIGEFERCMKVTYPENYFERFPLAQDCIDAGGCFVACGSGCGLPKPSIALSGMFEFYLGGSKACPTVCKSGCLYPVN